MARRLLRDIDPMLANIMDGKHDDLLSEIIQAAQARQKNRFRPGLKVRVKGIPELTGQVGEILKVNAKTINVGFGEYHHSEFGSYWDKEYRIDPRALEVVDG